jgi:hypothetical protein
MLNYFGGSYGTYTTVRLAGASPTELRCSKRSTPHLNKPKERTTSNEAKHPSSDRGDLMRAGDRFVVCPAALAARPTVHRHRIAETQLIAMVGYTGRLGAASYRRISGGTIDGTDGGRSIHGALRAVPRYPKFGLSIIHGTEFDAEGSRSFVIVNHYTISNGSSYTNGDGRWVGGTGTYSHARGRFKLTGGGQIGQPGTDQLRGYIVY